MSCTTTNLLWNTLNAEQLDVIVDTPTDPGSSTVEFSVVDIADQPAGGSWTAGTWIDLDTDLETDRASSRDGIFGWVARTPVIGPLAAGTYGLWIRISSGGGVQFVDRIDTIVVTGTGTGSSPSNFYVVPLPQFGQLYSTPVGVAWTALPYAMVVTAATVVTNLPPDTDETWEIYDAVTDDPVMEGTTTAGITSPGTGTITTTLPATIPAGTYGFRFTAQPGTPSGTCIVSPFGRFS